MPKEAVEAMLDLTGEPGASVGRVMVVAEYDATVEDLERFAQYSMSQARIHAVSFLLLRLGFPRSHIEWVIEPAIGDDPRAGTIDNVKIFLTGDDLPDAGNGEAGLGDG